MLPFLFFSLFGVSTALEVSPDSPCGAKCIDDPRTGNTSTTADSSTAVEDLACYDDQFLGTNSTQLGQKFADCNNCLKSSGYRHAPSNERDIQWFLVNNRKMMDWCTFGRNDQESMSDFSSSVLARSCDSECSPIRDAVDYRVNVYSDYYDFCDTVDNFTAKAQGCVDCLYKQDTTKIMGNGRYPLSSGRCSDET